jgi:hypothetical protein
VPGEPKARGVGGVGQRAEGALASMLVGAPVSGQADGSLPDANAASHSERGFSAGNGLANAGEAALASSWASARSSAVREQKRSLREPNAREERSSHKRSAPWPSPSCFLALTVAAASFEAESGASAQQWEGDGKEPLEIRCAPEAPGGAGHAGGDQSAWLHTGIRRFSGGVAGGGAGKSGAAAVSTGEELSPSSANAGTIGGGCLRRAAFSSGGALLSFRRCGFGSAPGDAAGGRKQPLNQESITAAGRATDAVDGLTRATNIVRIHSIDHRCLMGG